MAEYPRTPGECLTLGGHDGSPCSFCGRVVPDRPPALPRCRECKRIVGSQGHASDCSVGRAADTHWGNVRAVEKALSVAIKERRNDREFMARLRHNIERHSDLLALLADPHQYGRTEGDQ